MGLKKVTRKLFGGFSPSEKWKLVRSDHHPISNLRKICSPLMWLKPPTIIWLLIIHPSIPENPNWWFFWLSQLVVDGSPLATIEFFWLPHGKLVPRYTHCPSSRTGPRCHVANLAFFSTVIRLAASCKWCMSSLGEPIQLGRSQPNKWNWNWQEQWSDSEDECYSILSFNKDGWFNFSRARGASSFYVFVSLSLSPSLFLSLSVDSTKLGKLYRVFVETWRQSFDHLVVAAFD